MWVTMGPMADRTKDRLGASDMAVVEFRKQMLEALRGWQSGQPAIGTGAQAVPLEVCSFQRIIEKTTDWRQYPARPVWLDEAQSGMDQAYVTKG